VKKERRWMKSVLATSAEIAVAEIAAAAPWLRGQRRRPAALRLPAALPVQARTPGPLNRAIAAR
jgi:hypothetical protein